MNKKMFLCLVILIPLLLSTLSCSRSFQADQMRFGIDAAKRELWDEAIFRWQKVLSASPNSAAAHNNLAVAYEQKGLYEDASKEYEAAKRLAPNNKYILSNIEQFEKLRQGSKKEETKTDEKKK